MEIVLLRITMDHVAPIKLIGLDNLHVAVVYRDLPRETKAIWSCGVNGNTSQTSVGINTDPCFLMSVTVLFSCAVCNSTS